MPEEITFNNGLVTARDENALGPGEMSAATGIYYKPGDTERAHKIGGRSAFGTVTSGAGTNEKEIKGLALCLFDSGGTDLLLALNGADGSTKTITKATPGAMGTFTSLSTGLSASTTHMTSIQADDKWYIATGYDNNKVLKSDGTVRRHGMRSPDVQPVCTASALAETLIRPATQSDTGNWVNMNNARDTDDTNFAHGSLSAAGTVTGSWVLTAAATTTYQLRVAWQVGGLQFPGRQSWPPASFGVGGKVDSGFKVNVTITYTKSSGGGAQTLRTSTAITTAQPQIVTEQISLSLNSAETVTVTITMTYVSGTSQATIRHYFSKLTLGSGTTAFNSTTGFYYAITEYDSVNGLESAPGPISDLVELTADNQVSVTLPSATKNTNTTHYNIYRTYDGGTAPGNLGLVESVPSTQTAAYVDNFLKFAVDEQPLPIVPLVAITVSNADGTSGQLLFARDSEPPALQHINFYKGSIVGTSALKPRALYYSEAGILESFPEINVIENFPLPENDRLVATATVGDTLVIAAKGAILTLSDLPRVTNGQFNAAESSPLRGQPGCVGVYALCTFSVAGESRAAWVSPYGVHETNGVQARRISADINWDTLVETTDMADAIIHWDRNRQVLILCAPQDSGTDNDRFYLIHMSPEHEKRNGQPKWTGPHYGKIRSIVSGRTSDNVHRLYSGHINDGKVYLEDNGTTDESTAYSSTQVPILITTGKMYEDHSMWSVARANLRHTSFGSGQTVSVSWVAGRDSTGTSQTAAKTVSVNGALGTEFLVDRAGEWHQVSITHTGSAGGALRDIRMRAKLMGLAGKVQTS